MKKNKDVLFMCQFFYPEYVSSAMLPFQTAEKLASSNLKVGVMCGFPREYSSKSDVKKKETLNGIEINRMKYIQIGRKNKISRLINYFSFTLVSLLNVWRARKYKVIVVYSNPPILPLVALLSKRLFKTKIVYVCYDIYPEIAVKTNSISETGFITKMMNYLNKKLYKESSKVIALSKDMKNFIHKNRVINADKIEIIPNWATEDFIEKEILEEPLFIKLREENELIISYFGNMGTAQDITTILKAQSDPRIKNRDIFFLYAGHGNKKEELKIYLSEKRLSNGIVLDFLKGNEFVEALNISDLFIVSLDKELSGLAVPSKTYSYYQAGKPVVAIMNKNTDIYQEICGTHSGISVENDDVESLVENIIEVYENRDELELMKSNVISLYRDKYQKDTALEKYVNAIHSVLEE